MKITCRRNNNNETRILLCRAGCFSRPELPYQFNFISPVSVVRPRVFSTSYSFNIQNQKIDIYSSVLKYFSEVLLSKHQYKYPHNDSMVRKI